MIQFYVVVIIFMVNSGMIECVHLRLHISRGCRPSIVLLPHHSSVHRDSLVLRLLNFHQIVLYLLILNLQLLEGLLLFFQLLLVILDCNSELLIVKRVQDFFLSCQ